MLVAPVGARGGHGKIVRRIGRPDVARDVLEALMLDRGLRRRFDPLVEREAREARRASRRRAATDLRELPTFTIDPPTARDFDDAISAEALDDGAIRVWVHIADVSAHVKPGSAVDREAFRRATTVYVPGRSSRCCPRRCPTAPARSSRTRTGSRSRWSWSSTGAKVRRTAFHRSLIRSDARLDYPRVDRVFAGAERAEEPWAEPLDAARRGGGRAAGGARARAARWPSSRSSPSSRSPATATSRRWRRPSRPSRTG